MNFSKKYFLGLGLLGLIWAGCNNSNINTSSGIDSAKDTVVLDSTIDVSGGVDTLEKPVSDGVDGTGKPNTDRRIRRQQ